MNVMSVRLILCCIWAQIPFIQIKCEFALSSIGCTSGTNQCSAQMRKYNRTTTVINGGLNITNISSKTYANVEMFGRNGAVYSKIPLNSQNFTLCSGLNDEFIMKSIMDCSGNDRTRCPEDGEDIFVNIKSCVLDLSKFTMVAAIRNDIFIQINIMDQEGKLIAAFFAQGHEVRPLRRRTKSLVAIGNSKGE